MQSEAREALTVVEMLNEGGKLVEGLRAILPLAIDSIFRNQRNNAAVCRRWRDRSRWVVRRVVARWVCWAYRLVVKRGVRKPW